MMQHSSFQARAHSAPVTAGIRARSAIPRRQLPRVIPTASAASELKPADACVELLRQGALNPGTVPPHALLKSMVDLEKARLQAEPSWQSTLTAPGSRWRLIYTAGSEDVQAASKERQGKAGIFWAFLPFNACQKFEDGVFENGVFLGPIGSLTFKGPFTMAGKKLTFDVDTMTIGLGPFWLPIPLKESKPIEQREQKDQKGLPFFLYAYLDEDIIVGRGRSGGLALWRKAEPEWLAQSGVLQVYK